MNAKFLSSTAVLMTAVFSTPCHEFPQEPAKFTFTPQLQYSNPKWKSNLDSLEAQIEALEKTSNIRPFPSGAVNNSTSDRFLRKASLEGSAKVYRELIKYWDFQSTTKPLIVLVGGALDQGSDAHKFLPNFLGRQKLKGTKAVKKQLRHYVEQHPEFQAIERGGVPIMVKYFTWDKEKEIAKYVNRHLNQASKHNLQAPVVLVGHSYGADSALQASRNIRKVDLLVTLDGVSRRRSTSKAKTIGTWINVYRGFKSVHTTDLGGWWGKRRFADHNRSPIASKDGITITHEMAGHMFQFAESEVFATLRGSNHLQKIDFGIGEVNLQPRPGHVYIKNERSKVIQVATYAQFGRPSKGIFDTHMVNMDAIAPGQTKKIVDAGQSVYFPETKTMVLKVWLHAREARGISDVGTWIPQKQNQSFVITSENGHGISYPIHPRLSNSDHAQHYVIAPNHSIAQSIFGSWKHARQLQSVKFQNSNTGFNFSEYYGSRSGTFPFVQGYAVKLASERSVQDQSNMRRNLIFLPTKNSSKPIDADKGMLISRLEGERIKMRFDKVFDNQAGQDWVTIPIK